MPGDELVGHKQPGRGAIVAAVAVVITPLLLLGVLRTWPTLDLRWDNQPAHFCLVLAASAIAAALGYTVTVAARRRRDARLFIISLAFLSGSGFLGLHALATPGVLMGPNADFELATPLGLVIGSVFVAFSAVEFRPEVAQRVMARSRLMLRALVALIVLWGFTTYSEAARPTEVQGMVKTYFSRLVPLMGRFGGEVHQLIGDANPEWPRFRVGVNSGEVVAGDTRRPWTPQARRDRRHGQPGCSAGIGGSRRPGGDRRRHPQPAARRGGRRGAPGAGCQGQGRAGHRLPAPRPAVSWRR